MTYKELSSRIQARVEKKKRRERFISHLLFETSWQIFPAVCMVVGMICLQSFWGQYMLVKVLWAITSIVCAATVWYAAGDCRAALEGDDDV